MCSRPLTSLGAKPSAKEIPRLVVGRWEKLAIFGDGFQGAADAGESARSNEAWQDGRILEATAQKEVFGRYNDDSAHSRLVAALPHHDDLLVERRHVRLDGLVRGLGSPPSDDEYHVYLFHHLKEGGAMTEAKAINRRIAQIGPARRSRPRTRAQSRRWRATSPTIRWTRR